MTREAQIPLVLWITAATVWHLAAGGGVSQVAEVLQDKRDLIDFARGVRTRFAPDEQTFEVTLEPMAEPPPALPPPRTPGQPSPDDVEDDAERPAERAAETKPLELPRLEPPPPEAAPEKKREEPRKAVVEVTPAPPRPVEPIPQTDKRIAIKQHVEKDQPDNPSASRIADDAHHAEEESVARIRSYDQDDPNPTPGVARSGPKGEVGDGEDERPGHAEEKKGDEERAPGESKEASASTEHQQPAPENPRVSRSAPPAAGGPGGAGERAPRALEPSAGGRGPASPEAHAARDGSYALDPSNPGGDGSSQVGGRKRPRTKVGLGGLGLGQGAAPGEPNLNLTHQGAVAAIGTKKLAEERAADGASRKSAHRGTWETNKFERWRAAIENYEPSVKLGNQTSLNAARVPFASYLNAIHNRLHPIFADEFLTSLDSLPNSHTLNQDLVTHLEIVLDRNQGRIIRMGVVKASGVTAFDVVALNSVSRASPYGKAPDAVVSPDGNVYLHWEFHRDPFDACTTRNARPFLLKAAPAPEPPRTPPPKPRPPSDELREPAGPLLPMRSG